MTSTVNILSDYLSDLNSAASAKGCMAVTRQHVGKLGFCNVVFGFTRRPRDPETNLPPYLRFSTISKAWEERYRQMGYQNDCPIYRETLRDSTLPVVWQQIWDRIDVSPSQRRMLDEAASHGVTHGISISIKEKNGDRCGIGISTDLGCAEARQAIDRHLPLLFLMTHHLHAIMMDRYVDLAPHGETKPLTASELDCLYWVAAGKSTWDISEIRGISTNTVKFHLRNVLVKLDVPTRAAAVAKAFQLGLLDY